MANSTIAIDEPATIDKKLDTEQLTVGANTVERERVQIAGASDVAISSVLNAAPSTEYGLVTRNIPSGTQLERANDGTNSETVLFDVDSGGGSQFARGVSLRLPASGGSIAAFSARSVSDTISAVGNGTSLSLEGLQSVGLEVSGTFTGLDLRCQVSTDDGTTFRDVDAYDLVTETTKLTISAVGSYAWFIVPGGTSHARVRVAAISTGSVTAAVRGTFHQAKQHVAHDRVPGSSDPSHVVALGASDGTNLQRLVGKTTLPAAADRGLVVREAGQGQATMAASQPVVIASDQSNVGVAVNVFPDNEPFNLNQYGGTATTLGQKAMASSVPVVIASDQSKVTVAISQTTTDNDVDANITNTSLTVAQATASSLNAEVQGDAAHDAVASGNPVQTGSVASLNEPTAVADNDAVRFWADQLGRQVILAGHANPEVPVTVANVAAANTQLIAAPGAGVSLYVKKGSVHNRGAEQVVSMKEGSAGTIRWNANLAADGGGSLFDFGDRGWKLPANTGLFADSGAGGADFNITEYYIAA